MSKGDKHIENLFRDTFENFESDVNPDLWTNIQGQISSPTGPTGTEVSGGSSSGGFSSMVSGSAGLTKVAAVIGITGSVIAGGYLLTDTEEVTKSDDKIQNTEIVTQSTEEINEQNTAKAFETPANENSSVEITKDADINLNEDVDDLNENQSIESTISSTPVTTPLNTESTVQPAQSPVNTDIQNSIQQESKTSNNPGISASIDTKDNSTVNNNANEDVYLPEASIHASVLKGGIPLRVQFRNNDASAETMEWNFGDGSDVNTAYSPMHIFENPGEYKVILTVSGANNHISRDTLVIRATQKLSVSVPNVITPNYDGINDVFMVEIDEADLVKSFTCIVQNRSGKTVYESNNVYSHWDGRDLSNADCPQGTYLYVVKVQGMDGTIETLKGVVTLRR